MAERDNIEDGLLYKIPSYFLWFFLINLYFLISNLLLALCIFTLDFKFENILFFFISLIPTGPSLTAIFSSMAKINRDRDINPTSYYFKSYKSNFKQSFKLWLIELSLVFMLIVDIKFFNTYSNLLFLTTLFIILLIVVLTVGLYAFPILSRYEIKIASIIKLSFYYMIRRFNNTIINVCILLSVLFLFSKMPTTALFFAGSLASYGIILNNNKIFNDIQNRFIHK